MGENSTEGVVDKNNKIFRYKNLYIIDSSMISANLGVNLSLSITAIAERAMDQIPIKTLRFLMKITVINQR
jgi:cholesterol oxidase